MMRVLTNVGSTIGPIHRSHISRGMTRMMLTRHSIMMIRMLHIMMCLCL